MDLSLGVRGADALRVWRFIKLHAGANTNTNADCYSHTDAHRHGDSVGKRGFVAGLWRYIEQLADRVGIERDRAFVNQVFECR